MFDAGLSDLFECVAVTGTAFHAIQVLRNNGMIIRGVCKPVQIDRTKIT